MKSLLKVLFIILCVPFLFSSCSNEDDNDSEGNKDYYIALLESKSDQLKSLADVVVYGEKKGQYPVESKSIIDDAIAELENSITEFKNGTKSTKSDYEAIILMVENKKKEFLETIRTEDVITYANLFVNGENGGYINFGSHQEYCRFGENGKQAFTVETYVKLKRNKCNFILSTFRENHDEKKRTGWGLNQWDGNMRFSYSLYEPDRGDGNVNYGLLEPNYGFDTYEEWVHFAIVMNEQGVDGDKNGNDFCIVKIYENGELRTTEYWNMVDKQAYYNSDNWSTLMIGFGNLYPDGTINSMRSTNGYMKYAYIWDTPMSKEQIVARIAADKAGEVPTAKTPHLVCGWNFDRIPNNDKKILDITEKFNAELVGDYTWEPTK